VEADSLCASIASRGFPVGPVQHVHLQTHGNATGKFCSSGNVLWGGPRTFAQVAGNGAVSHSPTGTIAIRDKNPNCEFLLVSPLRFDPSYTTNSQYWDVVGEYATKLKGMTTKGVQFVDVTGISELVYAAKKPKDCLNDPLHPNEYFARWYAQCLAAAFDPGRAQQPQPMLYHDNKKRAELRLSP
jgi:hypothetical protein